MVRTHVQGTQAAGRQHQPFALSTPTRHTAALLFRLTRHTAALLSRLTHHSPSEYKIQARAHLDKIQTWFPHRDGRHFLVVSPDPKDSGSERAFRRLLQDLLDRDRAGVVAAPHGRVIHLVPPTPEMLKRQVVPPQHKDKLVAVYGKKR